MRWEQTNLIYNNYIFAPAPKNDSPNNITIPEDILKTLPVSTQKKLEQEMNLFAEAEIIEETL